MNVYLQTKWFWVRVQLQSLKLSLISKFMTLQTGQQIIVILILPSITRSKGNQTMEFGNQYITYITWTIFFLKNHAQSLMEKLVPDPLIKNLNWAYIWINNQKYYQVFFIVCPSGGFPRYIKIKALITCFYLM